MVAEGGRGEVAGTRVRGGPVLPGRRAGLVGHGALPLLDGPAGSVVAGLCLSGDVAAGGGGLPRALLAVVLAGLPVAILGFVEVALVGSHLTGDLAHAHAAVCRDELLDLGVERHLGLVVEAVGAGRGFGAQGQRRTALHLVEGQAHIVDKVAGHDAARAEALDSLLRRDGLDARSGGEQQGEVAAAHLVGPAEIAHLLGEQAGRDARQDIAGAGRAQGRGARLGHKRGLDAGDAAHRALRHHGEVGRAHGPRKLLAGLHALRKAAERLGLTAHESGELAGVRGEHERGLSAKGRRVRLGAALADAHEGVEGVGVGHKGRRARQERADDLNRPQGGAHARPDEHAVGLARKLGGPLGGAHVELAVRS